ncbi:MAC/perforin domain-containing protein [Flavobacterium undicola]|uniref:MAC/perforin domain-containing protein n=1 Tax=Flavobacterium undicola TaxID=1932779 RepID=UPI00137891E5|nr:MAC/perforin domain-containing protein [Flavobacterium undicola]MBA0885558.1 hypothetical protein [Flavobacterium undicola]
MSNVQKSKNQMSIQDVMTPELNLVPGSSVLGFGINIARSSGPSDVTARIVNINESEGSPVIEGGVSYLLPANVNLVDDSKFSIEFNTFSSRNEFSKHMAAETQIEASGWGFTGEFDAAYSSLTEGESVSIYGLVESNVKLWTLSVESLQSLSLDSTFKAELDALPQTFTPATQQAFFNFFNKYGTHVVTTSIVGGRLHYVTAVSSASQFDKETAKVNMSFEYDSVFVDTSGSASADWENIAKSWFSSRKAELMVIGGDPTILAKALPPDDPNTPVNYQSLVADWTTSVKTTPSVTGLQLQPISHVAPAAAGNLLDQALEKYLNSSARGQCLMEIDLTVGVPVGAACTINMGTQEILPPNPPTKSQLSMYWIVMTDHEGNLKFNENFLSSDPDDFDTLVSKAQKTSEGQNWWTVVIVATTPPRPVSVEALAWMESCGILITNIDMGYPNWPILFSGVGKSNTPAFDGQFNLINSPYFENPDNLQSWQQSVEVEIPLYVTI